MNRIIKIVTFILIFFVMPIHSTPVEWGHKKTGYKGNNQVTVKDLQNQSITISNDRSAEGLSTSKSPIVLAASKGGEGSYDWSEAIYYSDGYVYFKEVAFNSWFRLRRAEFEEKFTFKEEKAYRLTHVKSPKDGSFLLNANIGNNGAKINSDKWQFCLFPNLTKLSESTDNRDTIGYIQDKYYSTWSPINFPPYDNNGNVTCNTSHDITDDYPYGAGGYASGNVLVSWDMSFTPMYYPQTTYTGTVTNSISRAGRHDNISYFASFQAAIYYYHGRNGANCGNVCDLHQVEPGNFMSITSHDRYNHATLDDGSTFIVGFQGIRHKQEQPYSGVNAQDKRQLTESFAHGYYSDENGNIQHFSFVDSSVIDAYSGVVNSNLYYIPGDGLFSFFSSRYGCSMSKVPLPFTGAEPIYTDCAAEMGGYHPTGQIVSKLTQLVGSPFDPAP